MPANVAVDQTDAPSSKPGGFALAFQVEAYLAIEPGYGAGVKV